MSPTSSSAKGDNSQVEDKEYLLRRFPNEPDNFNFVLLTPKLSCFLPSKADEDGLSLNREGDGFLDAERMLALARSENVRLNGGVVAVLTLSVRQNGMTVNPDPGDTPGHVIIPEINRTDYDRIEADGTRPIKQRIKELADILARLAIGQIRIMPKPKNKPSNTE